MGYTINEYHGQYNRVARSRSAIKYIVVHYVGSGTSAAGNAKNNCIYFSGGNRDASAHYFIDDASIWEYADPANWACWHVGDGKGKYGITNSNSIGIEVCNNGGAFTTAEIDRLTWLVQKLMAEYGVPANRVVRHYDASRKLCPLYYAQNQSAWNALWAQITGGKVSGSTTTSSVLEVDGYWGSATTERLQQVLGTAADGEIWHQYTGNKSRLAACTSGWQFDNTGEGSPCIKAMQRKLGVNADGLIGKDTINALIKHYQSASGATEFDGKLDGGSITVKAMQRALNKNTF